MQQEQPKYKRPPGYYRVQWNDNLWTIEEWKGWYWAHFKGYGPVLKQIDETPVSAEPIPDADRLREALKSIEQYSDPGSYLKAIVDMKAIATEALSVVGDGDGYEQSDSAIEAEREDWEEKQQEGKYETFKWLLGYNDFPQRQEGEGAYYWRTHLREKLKEIGIEINDTPPLNK